MNPAWSVVLFTTIAGAAQGLVVALAAAMLGGVTLSPSFVVLMLELAAVMLVVGLAASFLHLGRPGRAWRAAMKWRTSWLSREVIVLPAFIGLVALWVVALRIGAPPSLVGLAFPLAALVLAALLWVCTAMIYACLRFIEEWAHPLTVVNFLLIGLASGFVLAAAAGSLGGEASLVRVVGPAALVLTLAAWALRLVALRRNAGIRHKSTLQSATGIPSPQLQQKSMGMSAGSFNTREFFHRASLMAMHRVRLVLVVCGFALPSLLAIAALATGGALFWSLAVAVQSLGLVAERWFFFAQARHPQNLYYQVVS